jgi:hypothetical protein
VQDKQWPRANIRIVLIRSRTNGDGKQSAHNVLSRSILVARRCVFVTFHMQGIDKHADNEGTVPTFACVARACFHMQLLRLVGADMVILTTEILLLTSLNKK